MDIRLQYTDVIIVIIISLISLGGSEDLIILPLGEIHSRSTAENIVFTCEVTNVIDQDIRLRWFDPFMEEITETNGRIYIDNVDEARQKLYITNIQEYDEGTYKCEGTAAGNKQQATVTLEVYDDIVFEYAPSPQNPIEYDDALIHCRVHGSPAPEVSWRYRGETIETGGRYIIDVDYGLRIQNITEHDNGHYECRAELVEEGKMEKADIDVIVHKVPIFTKELGTTVGIEHQEVTMECKASGLPDPAYEFYRILEGGELSRVSSTEHREVDELAGTIDYRPLNRGDQAEYICVAINNAGQVESRGYLDVIIPPKIYQYINITQKQHKSATLVCLSEGEPSPDMTFRKVSNDYDYVEGENENGHVIVSNPESGRSELNIPSLLPNDTANYTCKSFNEGGHSEQNGTIIVEFPPWFPAQERNFHGWPGKTRNVTCSTYSEPAPVFEWIRRDKVLENNETYRIIPLIKNCVLQIYVRQEDTVWIFGEYTCSARNQHGSNQIDMLFQEATEPDKPKEVTVLDETPTILLLEVTPPDNNGGVPVIGYRVEYDSFYAEFTVDEDVIIEYLRPGTPYTFNVRARNEVDVSLPLKFSHSTLEVSTPYPIIIISPVEGLYPYEYTLLWEKPRTGGMPIQEYKFKYRRVTVKGEPWEIDKILDEWIVRYKQDEPENPMSSYKLEGLKPETHYQVEVIARNDIGWSTPGPEFIFLTYKAMDRPVMSATFNIGTSWILLMTNCFCVPIFSLS